MQEKHIQEKLNKSYPYIDLIFGTHTLNKLPENLYNILAKKQKMQDIIDIERRHIRKHSNKKRRQNQSISHDNVWL